MNLKSQMRYLNSYEIHKLLVNEYILRKPGDTKLFTRDTSKDRTDYHVIKENHRFLWNDKTTPETWEEQFAKKYYEKLFKEYCIADLSLYKENKIALRWRTEKEVVVGKGQFICGNKHCGEKESLKTWEVNFAYKEQGEKKNALVKLRLCPSCSTKLNYHSKKREIKRIKKDKLKKHGEKRKTEVINKEIVETNEKSCSINDPSSSSTTTINNGDVNADAWQQHEIVEIKSREEEMEDYLQDLLL